MKEIVAFLLGILFALGLGISGMTQPHIVQGFLDITGNWDFRLAGVMIGAIAIHAVSYKLIMKRSSPLLDKQFYLPQSTKIDRKLFFGAVIFGIGWGWVGICPGPGLVGLTSMRLEFIYFVISMLAG